MIWYEKYKPLTIDDMILPEHIKEVFKGYYDNIKTLQNIGLFSVNAGTGKSSLAKIFSKHPQVNCLFVNASLDNGINVVRSKIQDFCTAQVFEDTVKLVILDEFDYFTIEGQSAFRGFLDEFKDCRFIFTGNDKSRVIQPLQDRLQIFDFDSLGLNNVVKDLLERCSKILVDEKIEYDMNTLFEIVKDCYPRVRKIIGELYRCSRSGILIYNKKKTEDDLIKAIKDKNYESMKSICYNMNANNIVSLYSRLLEMHNNINIPIILAEYQYKHNFVVDKNLNLLACCSQLSKVC